MTICYFWQRQNSFYKSEGKINQCSDIKIFCYVYIVMFKLVMIIIADAKNVVNN